LLRDRRRRVANGEIATTSNRNACVLRVTSKTGEPLAGVGLAVEQATGPVPEIAYVTGDDGRVRMGLPSGEAVLRLFLPDGSSRCAKLFVRDQPDQVHHLQID
jgi:hypothetical protein